MSDIKNVKLSFSCPNLKNDLQGTSKGYHCIDCSKEIIDFTSKSQAELQEIIQSKNSRICGIFNKSQLNKTFIKYVSATALIGSSFVATAQNQNLIQADSVEQAFEFMGDIDGVDNNSTSDKYYYPEPIGRTEKFYKALMGNIKYPDSLKIDGKTFLRFTIDTLGSISKVEVIKGFNERADEEAIRALKSLNFPFKPANENGIPVESQLVIPVKFTRDQE